MAGSLLAFTLIYLRVTHLIIPLQLFVSKRSVFDGKKAIRGGVPFVFPIFGPSSVMPQHGFARISRLKFKFEFLRWKKWDLRIGCDAPSSPKCVPPRRGIEPRSPA